MSTYADLLGENDPPTGAEPAQDWLVAPGADVVESVVEAHAAGRVIALVQTPRGFAARFSSGAELTLTADQFEAISAGITTGVSEKPAELEPVPVRAPQTSAVSLVFPQPEALLPGGEPSGPEPDMMLRLQRRGETVALLADGQAVARIGLRVEPSGAIALVMGGAEGPLHVGLVTDVIADRRRISTAEARDRLLELVNDKDTDVSVAAAAREFIAAWQAFTAIEGR